MNRVNFFLSGYYGYDNAGDEAVLAAILDHISALKPQASFTITAGDPARVEQNHGSGRTVRAIGRQNPRHLVPAIRACDVFISGGGSLLQDVTSVRNVVYYTSLIRFARLSRKPVMIYAQGVGPLRKAISRKLARAALQSARIITLRDEDSKTLVQSLGVKRKIEVTADPVWALKADTATNKKLSDGASPLWGVALRSWPGEQGSESTARMVGALREAAHTSSARLRFLPMQHPADFAILQGAGVEDNEICGEPWQHPRQTMTQTWECDAVIAMRLHALIFAAAGRVPCVAINYDPKVQSLAKRIGAPLIGSATPHDLTGLQAAIKSAPPLDSAVLQELQTKARFNAELAVSLL